MSRHGRSLALAALCVAATSLAWLDPHQPVRKANELYRDGKYEDATAAYNAALVDKPDSDALHFNLGDSTYKQGNYDDAISAFQKVETAGDPARGSRVAYNVGNAKFRQGQALEQTDPQKALGLYAESLIAYRRALGLTPDDADSKFNHEYVTKHVEELKKRLEEQKKQQDEQKKDQQQQDQQQQNQDQQQQQDQQKQDQQQGDQQQQQDQQQQDQQQQGDQQQEQQKQDEQGQQDQQQQQEDQQQGDQKDEQQQAGGEQQDEQKQDQQQQGQEGGAPSEQNEKGEQQGEPTGDAVAGEKKDGELSKGEAAAILDSQRGEEVSPEDVIKKLQGARVAEPAQDW